MYADRNKDNLISAMIYSLTTLIGLLAFTYPLVFPALKQLSNNPVPRSAEMPVMMTLLLGICLIVLLYEVQGQSVDAKLVSLLGLLVSINAALRFLEVAIPGPGGFSPIFFLIVLTGYVFGGRFGFLIGSMTILISALLTGGIGPWLPGQMFTAGWVGMSAPLCRPFVILISGKGRFREIFVLAVFGGLWGFLYGAFMNLWSWPFITGPVDQYWEPGITWLDAINRYAAYYLVTSLVWDLARTAGNFIFILIFGGPTLRALRRFRSKFSFQYELAQQLKPDLEHKGQLE